MTRQSLNVLGIVSSPSGGWRTRTAVEAVAWAADATASVVDLDRTDRVAVLRQMAAADAVVLGSPVYRASYTAELKTFLDATERGKHGETSAPLSGTAVAIVMTGASPHHFLAPEQLRTILCAFFAAQVLAPSLYLAHDSFDGQTLTTDAAGLAARQGRALAELARAVRDSPDLRTLVPLI